MLLLALFGKGFNIKNQALGGGMLGSLVGGEVVEGRPYTPLLPPLRTFVFQQKWFWLLLSFRTDNLPEHEIISKALE